MYSLFLFELDICDLCVEWIFSASGWKFSKKIDL